MSIESISANTGSEANGTTAERQFDALLRLTNLVNRADAGILSSFALTLDDADQRTQVIREDGKIYTYSYDAIGQLTNASAALPDGTPWSGYQFSYAYDATGNPVEQNKNGLVYSNSFNNLNQNAETRFAGALAALGTYASPLAATVTVNNVQAQLHDGDWAATGIPFVQGTNALARTIQDLAGRSSAVTSTVVVADRAYAYDANGNMTTNGVFTYVWDCENRLIEVWKNGALVQSNRYDALWRRREKIEYSSDGTAVTNRYIYKDWLVLAITDGSGAPLETYTHGADLSGHVGGKAGGIGGILTSTQSGTAAIYHYDFNGNIVNVASSNQSLQASFTYSVFGEVLHNEGTFSSLYQFSSKEYDVAAGLIYYGYRFFSASLARWLNRDPIGESNDLALYCFVHNTPPNLVDTKGLEWWKPSSWGNADSVPRDDERWNDPNHVRADNCYEYAWNRHGNPNDPNNDASFMQPGDYSGQRYSQITCDEITRRAKADGMIDAGGSSSEPCCPDGYHLVYLVVAPYDDYHWYRKDSKAFWKFWRGHRWSHKPGQTPVTELDASEKLIYDPAQADTDYSRKGGPNYQKCGYLCAPN